MLDFLTPQVFDALILGVVLIGGALAILRLYRDLSRPPRGSRDFSGPAGPENDTPPDDQ